MAKLSTTDIFGELKVSLNTRVKTINDWLYPTQINLASLDTNGNFIEGRGLVVGYSGTDYPGIGYNVRHTATSKNFIIPNADTASYIFFRNGNVQFGGVAAQTAGATVSFATNAEITKEGNINSFRLLPCSNINNSNYNTAAIEIRELNKNGAQADNPAVAPRLSFNWGGRVASQIILRSDGKIAIVNNLGSDYEGLVAGFLESTGSMHTATNYINTAGYAYISSGVNGFAATTGTTQSALALRLRGADNAVLDFGCNSATGAWIQSTDRTSLNASYPLFIQKNGGTTTFGGTVTAASFNWITGFDATTPAMNGTAAVGSATTVARRDHVHPTDTTRADVGQTMYIGTTAVTINRASAALTLAGISLTTPDVGAATGTSLSTTGSVIAAGGLGVNSATGTGVGISLYGGAVPGVPNYGLTFATTTTGGKHGAVTGDWATYFTVDGATNRGWVFKNGITSSGNAASISCSGAASFNGDVTAFASDERLKTEFVKIENSLELTKQLDTGYYYFNELAAGFGFDSSKRQVGVKAGQLEKLLPEVVAPAPFDSGKDGSVTGENYLTVKYEKLTALLIQNIKDLTAEVEKLKNNK